MAVPGRPLEMVERSVSSSTIAKIDRIGQHHGGAVLAVRTVAPGTVLAKEHYGIEHRIRDVALRGRAEVCPAVANSRRSA